MKIALVHDWLAGMRGGEQCLERACRLFPDSRLYTLLYHRGSVSGVIERMPIATSPLGRLPVVWRYYRYLLPLMPRAIEAIRIPREVDLVLSLSHCVAKSVRVPEGVPHLCYCFTPMRYAWEMREAYFATDSTLPCNRLGSRLRVQARMRNRILDRLREWDRVTSQRVHQFVAISRNVQRRIRSSYGRDSLVIYPPVNTDYFTPSREPRDGYYLCVSALVPYKRIDLAIAACNRLGRRLVIIGQGPEAGRLTKLAGPTVQLLGWQPRSMIRSHYRRCRALLFPGEEDFGIVPVEAQACGTPVIALRRGGALETICPPSASAPGSGLFFARPTSESLIDAILQFERATEICSPETARSQALQFSSARFDMALSALVTSYGIRRTEPRRRRSACGSRWEEDSPAPHRAATELAAS